MPPVSKNSQVFDLEVFRIHYVQLSEAIRDSKPIEHFADLFIFAKRQI